MLKKCVAIMALFALVAGAAFAQVTFGGQLQEGMTLFSGSNINDADVNMGGGYYGDGPYHEAKFSALFGDGTAGGRLVYDQLDKGGRMWGWMQWRPNQFFRVKVGSDGDGEGGFAQIAGWGFTAEAKNSVAAVNDYGGGGLAMTYRYAGLNYGGYDGASSFNLQFTVFPTDLIAVNFLFRDFTNSDNAAEEISQKFAKMQIYTSIKLEEVGTIRFAAVGNGGLAKDQEDGADIGTLWLAFYSNEIVQGLAFEVGGNYNLPHLNESDTFGAIHAALGVNFTGAEPFGVKLRVGSEFGGQTKGVESEKVGFGIGILPSYKLPKMTVFFHAGFGMEQKDKDSDATYNWFINPYVWVPMGGMRMWVGLQIIDDHAARDDEAAQFKWSVPFGFNFYF